MLIIPPFDPIDKVLVVSIAVVAFIVAAFIIAVSLA
jgi:hypothetical protein